MTVEAIEPAWLSGSSRAWSASRRSRRAEMIATGTKRPPSAGAWAGFAGYNGAPNISLASNLPPKELMSEALRVLDLRFECAYFLEFLFAHADPLAGEWLLGHAAADASYAQLDAVMAGAHARAPTLDLRPFAQCARLARVLVGGCEKDGQTFPDVSTLGELRQRRPEIRADWRVLHHWVD